MIAQANGWLVLMAIISQMTIYVLFIPGMQGFFKAARIHMTSAYVFGLLATGLAMSRIVPFGDYLFWRTSLRKYRGHVSATTQWMIVYYTWLFAGLLLLFIAAEIATLILFPNPHVGHVLESLRYLPFLVTFIFAAAGCLSLSKRVRHWFMKIAFDKLGSSAVAPRSIVRDLKIDAATLWDLTIASLASGILESFTLYMCLASIGVNPPLVLIMLAFTFARFFSMLPLTPGGVGEIEAGLVLFFAAYGYPWQSIFTAAVMYRLISYWPPLLIGLATLGLRNRSWGAEPGVHANQMHRLRQS